MSPTLILGLVKSAGPFVAILKIYNNKLYSAPPRKPNPNDFLFGSWWILTVYSVFWGTIRSEVGLAGWYECECDEVEFLSEGTWKESVWEDFESFQKFQNEGSSQNHLQITLTHKVWPLKTNYFYSILSNWPHHYDLNHPTEFHWPTLYDLLNSTCRN